MLPSIVFFTITNSPEITKISLSNLGGHGGRSQMDYKKPPCESRLHAKFQPPSFENEEMASK